MAGAANGEFPKVSVQCVLIAGEKAVSCNILNQRGCKKTPQRAAADSKKESAAANL